MADDSQDQKKCPKCGKKEEQPINDEWECSRCGHSAKVFSEEGESSCSDSDSNSPRQELESDSTTDRCGGEPPKPDIIGVKGVGKAENQFVSFAQPESEIGWAWREKRDEAEPLFSADTIQETIESRKSIWRLRIEGLETQEDYSGDKELEIAKAKAVFDELSELEEVFSDD